MENSTTIDRISNLPVGSKLHPLENLHFVSTLNNGGITLWPSIFIFPTLVVLKLTKLKAVNNISIDLPSLKTLHFNHISLKNKDNFNKLLNECPLLEDLETRDIYYIEKQCKGVRLKTLSKLMRANIDASDVPVKAIYNVQFLQLKVRYFDTKFHWINIMYCSLLSSNF
jgi:hypothetical protein